MKKQYIVFLLVIVMCFSFSCQKPEAAALTDEDVEAIKALYDDYIQSLLSSNWDAWASVFTDDAIIMPPNIPLIQGREAILAYQQAFPPLTELRAETIEVYGQGDLAYARGTYSLTIEIPGAPEPIQDTGKLVSIFRKQADGRWLFALDIYNSDLPLPSQPEEK